MMLPLFGKGKNFAMAKMAKLGWWKKVDIAFYSNFMPWCFLKAQPNDCCGRGMQVKVPLEGSPLCLQPVVCETCFR